MEVCACERTSVRPRPASRAAMARAQCGCIPAVASTPRNDSASSSERRLESGSIPTHISLPTPAWRAAATIGPTSASMRYRWQWVSTANDSGSGSPSSNRDSSEATVVRMVIITFTKKFDRMNPIGIAAEARKIDPTWGPHDLILNTERPGVFNWALAGLTRALERGGFVNTEEGEAILKEARKDSNIVAGFMPDCIDYDADVMISTVDFSGPLMKWFGEQHGDRKGGGPSQDMIGRHLANMKDPMIVRNKDKYKLKG